MLAASEQRAVESVLNECIIGSRILAERMSYFLDRLTGSGQKGQVGANPEPQQPFYMQPLAISDQLRRADEILKKCESILFENGTIQAKQDRY